MEMVYDLLKITIPAVLILYSTYLMVRSFFNKQLDELHLTLRHKNQETVLPVRMQAYERVCLLLERISPNNIIPRLNEKGMTAGQLQGLMVSEIRNELNHNLSQQVYMSDDAWIYVKSAVEQLISMINESANELRGEATSLDLAKKVFEKNVSNQTDTISGALGYIKNEIRELF
ncbi:MAG: hypothetical protein CMB80_04570 [Flammeovirgaceae bacterium]|nr:hypothetical protein [Flammeovirgaceae bacterium]MBE61864.1 hypothetical protein [Flammeovirgaceae bacterium]MBR09708.1 hypothetical protein [Rickettsiales bacterium]|tara:strand:- start:661 stop:1182 length:522 start_codon:yes stop_codon:yes gene_type:complete